MEQPNYPAVERAYTAFKTFVLFALITALLVTLYQVGTGNWAGNNDVEDIADLIQPEEDTSSVGKVIRSEDDTFSSSIIPPDASNDEGDNDDEAAATPTLRATVEPDDPEPVATPRPTETPDRLADALITWENAMIDADFTRLTLDGNAPFGEDIRILLNDDELDGIEISRDDMWIVETDVPESGTHTVTVELLNDNGNPVKRFRRDLEIPERP